MQHRRNRRSQLGTFKILDKTNYFPLQSGQGCTKLSSRAGPMEETLQVLVREENRTPVMLTNDIRECKSNLFSILDEEFRGAMVRCGLHAPQKEEKPETYF